MSSRARRAEKFGFGRREVCPLQGARVRLPAAGLGRSKAERGRTVATDANQRQAKECRKRLHISILKFKAPVELSSCAGTFLFAGRFRMERGGNSNRERPACRRPRSFRPECRILSRLRALSGSLDSGRIPDPALDLDLRAAAGDVRHDLAVPEQEHRRDAAHA